MRPTNRHRDYPSLTIGAGQLISGHSVDSYQRAHAVALCRCQHIVPSLRPACRNDNCAAQHRSTSCVQLISDHCATTGREDAACSQTATNNNSEPENSQDLQSIRHLLRAKTHPPAPVQPRVEECDRNATMCCYDYDKHNEIEGRLGFQGICILFPVAQNAHQECGRQANYPQRTRGQIIYLLYARKTGLHSDPIGVCSQVSPDTGIRGPCLRD